MADFQPRRRARKKAAISGGLFERAKNFPAQNFSSTVPPMIRGVAGFSKAKLPDEPNTK